MLETSNEVDEDKLTKENNISFSRDPIASFPSYILETVGKQKCLLMIEAEETPQNNNIGTLKENTFLFND